MKTSTFGIGTNRSARGLACWIVFLLSPCMAAAQIGQITFPAYNSQVSGITLVNLHVSASYDPTQVVLVDFQYSRDGVSWNEIGINPSFGNGSKSQSPNDWEAYWDTSTLGYEGYYSIRAVAALADGQTITSDTSSVYVSLGEVAPPADDNCKAKEIQVAKKGDTILGQDGKGKAWPESKGIDDGKTLGPLSKNPDNTEDYWGYGFEVRVKVEGNPDKCPEIQLVRATYRGEKDLITKEVCENRDKGFWREENHKCYWFSRWSGTTNDFDQDGTIDLDMSNLALCNTFRGEWSGGMCKEAIFPSFIRRYKPDEPIEGKIANGYRKPYTFKKHPEKLITWYDTPMMQNIKTGDEITTGVKASLNFVAIVRGTNQECGKGPNKYCYCYADYNVRYVVGEKDSEDLTLNKKACGVDVTQVPGLVAPN